MFKKKPNIKAFAPLRSSDRRKIADQIISDFAVEIPPAEVLEGQDQKQAENLNLTSIRNVLFPENSLSARFTTTTGPDAKPVSGTVYAGTHTGDEQRVLWFKLHDRLIPTVYTLWKNPGLIPLLHTPGFVLEKLCHGSPLMTPGLAGGPPFPSEAVKNAIVAVASIERPTVPMMVGIAEIDIASLGQVQGSKGHAVRSEHWSGDEIWAWSTGGGSGGQPPESLEDVSQMNSAADSKLKIAQLSLDDEDEGESGGVAIDQQGHTAEPAKPRNDHVEGEDIEIGQNEEAEMTTKEIDEAFWRAFLYAIHQSKTKNKGEKNFGLQFPISQSVMMSHMVLPYLPTYTAKRAAALQIKKTSWKSPKKFIKALDKAKILKSKDRDGGECVVLDVDFNDQAITAFVPYRLPKKETPGKSPGDATEQDSASSSASAGDSSIGQTLKMVSLLRPKESLAPIFQASNAPTSNFYTTAELKPIVTTYIESENLISGTNKRLVNLNPVLANSVFDGSSSLDREVVAKGSVPRDALFDRTQQACSPFWILLRNDEARDGVKAKAGRGARILITLETRSGNKTVTKVSGVEVFHISPQLLAHELQKTCAGSTSVGQLVGSSPKHPIMEIMVQGPQNAAIIKALEKRGVSRGWIEVVDKSKGQKGTAFRKFDAQTNTWTFG